MSFDDFNDPSNPNNSDPSNPYDSINKYRRAMANSNNNSASGTWSAQTNPQDQQDQLDAQNAQRFQQFQQDTANFAAKSAQTPQQAPPATQQTPYSSGSNNYPSNAIQTTQFGTGLMDTLARIRRGQYLSQQQQQPGQNQNFQMTGVTYPQFNQNSQSGQNSQGGAQPAQNTQSTQSTPNSQFQTPSGQLDYGSLLKFYGVQQPDIRQSPFMSNTFMANHPTLGGALNSALFAAAGTQTERGPSGAGTGIANVLRGVAGAPGAEREFQMNQQMAPFQMADAMAKLYGTTAEAQMNQGRAFNYLNNTPEKYAAAQMRLQAAEDKLHAGNTPYSTQRVGANGFLYGTRKDTGAEEVIPGQPGIENYDPANPSGSKGAFNPAGSSKPDMTELYVRASQGDKGAQAAIDTMVRAQAQITRGRVGATNDANTPKDFITSETKGNLDVVGAPPKNTHAEYQSYQANKLTSGVPFDQIQDEATWAKGNTDTYNKAKAAAQQENSDYINSKAGQRGVSLQEWKANRKRLALTPGVSQQAAPASVPGSAQSQQAQSPTVVGVIKNNQGVVTGHRMSDGSIQR